MWLAHGRWYLGGPHAVLVRRPGRGHGRLNLRPSGPKKLQGVGRSGRLGGSVGTEQVISHLGVDTGRLLPYYGQGGHKRHVRGNPYFCARFQGRRDPSTPVCEPGGSTLRATTTVNNRANSGKFTKKQPSRHTSQTRTDGRWTPTHQPVEAGAEEAMGSAEIHGRCALIIMRALLYIARILTLVLMVVRTIGRNTSPCCLPPHPPPRPFSQIRR